MPELLWVIGMLVIAGAFAVVQLVPWPYLIELGNRTMFTCAGFGIPLELIYFALLGWSLTATGRIPKGWYWRSFVHHRLLGRRQRWLVLPFFYAGAIAFVGIVLGIALTVLGMVAAVTQR